MPEIRLRPITLSFRPTRFLRSTESSPIFTIPHTDSPDEMSRIPRRSTRHFAKRLSRSLIAFVLVVAQFVTAFGYPVVARAGQVARCGGGRCGCPTSGATAGCCCGPSQCQLPPPVATPEPDRVETESCPKCRDKKHAREASTPSFAMKWVVGMKARQCHGDGPLGLFADILAVTARDAVPAVLKRVPPRFSRPDNQLPRHQARVPLEPPPRCG